MRCSLARALLAHGCGKALRLFLRYLAPGIPPRHRDWDWLGLGVMLIEIAETFWPPGEESNG
jgi:hypothetical protein